MSATKHAYGYEVETRMAFGEAVERTREALKAQGFGVLTEIDVKETLKQKIGAEIEGYTILGACEPHLAKLAIGKEPNVGLLLPCNVLIREEGGKVFVLAQDPHLLVRISGNPSLSVLADEATTKIRHALDAVAGN